MTAIYRLDKFTLPVSARDELVQRIHATQALLVQQDGFVRDVLMEQPANEEGAMQLATLVEWRDEASMKQARVKVQAMHEEQGFAPRELFARLNIKADLGAFVPLD